MLEDSHGGWCRLLLRLELSGLAVVGVVSPHHLSVEPHLFELAASLRTHGVENPPIPRHPITYSRLIQELTSLGLLSNT